MSNVGNFKLKEEELISDQGTIDSVIGKIKCSISEMGKIMNEVTADQWMGKQRDEIMTAFEASNTSHLSFAESLHSSADHIGMVLDVYRKIEADRQNALGEAGVEGSSLPISTAELNKSAFAATLSIDPGIHTSSFRDENGKKINLWEFVPEGLTSNSALAVYIPGSGESGTNVNLVERTSLPYLIKNESITPDTIVLTLQAPGKGNYTEIYKAAIDEVVKKYQIDPSKISISGHSRGGIATYDMIAAYPDYFSSAAIISGYASESTQSKLKTSGTTTNIYAYHGTNDTSVKYSAGAQTARALNNAGINVTFTELKGSGHTIQNNVYSNEGYDILHHLFITS